MTDIQDKIISELDSIVDDLKEKHLQLGMKASGNWLNSLEVEIDGYTGIIKGIDYTTYLTKGRPPNRNSSHKELMGWAVWAGKTFIKDWVEAKGLPHNPMAVAYNIAKNGTSWYKEGGSDLVDGVITDDRVAEVQEAVGLQIGLSIAEELTRELQSI